jgi:lipoate-protein ligase A
MAKLFTALALLDERDAPGEPAWNMAMDESLLGCVAAPALRVYRWREPALTFGYFLRLTDARKAAGGRPVMRRWTGGGMVEHGQDFTWSLIVPATCAVHRMRPLASYGAIHAAVAEAMEVAGIPVHQVSLDTPAPAGGLCMAAPAPGDLLWRDRKVAGAGQRRSRLGLLHQGTIGDVSLPEDFPARLAASLSDTVTPFPPECRPVTMAESLVTTRYGTPEWLEMR